MGCFKIEEIRDKDNETGWKEGGGIEMSIYNAFHIRDARSPSLINWKMKTESHTTLNDALEMTEIPSLMYSWNKILLGSVIRWIQKGPEGCLASGAMTSFLPTMEDRVASNAAQKTCLGIIDIDTDDARQCKCKLNKKTTLHNGYCGRHQKQATMSLGDAFTRRFIALLERLGKLMKDKGKPTYNLELLNSKNITTSVTLNRTQIAYGLTANTSDLSTPQIVSDCIITWRTLFACKYMSRKLKQLGSKVYGIQ